MMKQRLGVIGVVVVLSLLMVLPAGASGLLAEEAAGVNLPGWVGGMLALLALALPLATSFWLRNKSNN